MASWRKASARHRILEYRAKRRLCLNVGAQLRRLEDSCARRQAALRGIQDFLDYYDFCKKNKKLEPKAGPLAHRWATHAPR